MQPAYRRLEGQAAHVQAQMQATQAHFEHVDRAIAAVEAAGHELRNLQNVLIWHGASLEELQGALEHNKGRLLSGWVCFLIFGM